MLNGFYFLFFLFYTLLNIIILFNSEKRNIKYPFFFGGSTGSFQVFPLVLFYRVSFPIFQVNSVGQILLSILEQKEKRKQVGSRVFIFGFEFCKIGEISPKIQIRQRQAIKDLSLNPTIASKNMLENRQFS
eukprot:TRINITY_DN43952_c0_g1_i1.p3 TRINITY_DN43952_c0_g1~~TRINITY_DN43952_c0_g1_i1.p3  ORF type:complete len:131 (+),score=4.42 TRINITY_DN43952_c0_g1_i1:106-498(+)